MKFTDIFISRPVLASVVSLLILLLGVKAIYDLPLRQYPKIEDSVITITTTYTGANANLIQGFITTPIQQAIAGVEGINFITSSSTQGSSTISVHLRLNYDVNEALTEIMAKVNQVKRQLPANADDPIISKGTGQGFAIMYLSFTSSELKPAQLRDYIVRVVQPRLDTLDGVAQAQVLGGQLFAMRIWLDPRKMAALGITPSEVNQALQANNFQAAVGQTKGKYIAINVDAQTDISDVKGFENLVIKHQGSNLVRLKDIARVELGAQNYDSSVFFNGKSATFIGINQTPGANPLTVAQEVRKTMPEIKSQLLPSVEARIVYDSTEYIQDSIKEVIKTIAEAGIIVILVIFAFLGAFRSVAIPVVTIPLSLVGVAFIMLLLGYSLNTLTLLAMVLSIGLVVDDAIVVVENIHRHIEEGLTPLEAAYKGAREIAMPVVVMSLTLAAVYAPIGFLGGLTGQLFTEFAFTLAGAVIISGIIALTLSPMMCAKILPSEGNEGRLAHWIERNFNRFKDGYQNILHRSLNYRPATIIVAVTVLISCGAFYMLSQHELAPKEDQGFVVVFSNGPQTANADYIKTFTDQFASLLGGIPGVQDHFIINGSEGVNSAFSGLILKPWSQRTESEQEVTQQLTKQINKVAGLQSFATGLPPLPGSAIGPSVEFVLQSIGDYRQLYQVAEQVEQAALKSGLFIFGKTDIKFDNPSIDLYIDRAKASSLGISSQEIGQALGVMLSEARTNYFSLGDRSYEVIPQLERKYRLNADLIKQIHVRTNSGTLVPLSTVISLKSSIGPSQISQFQQLNSVTLQLMPRPGVGMGEALQFLRDKTKEVAPTGISYDYSGQSRQFVQEGTALVYTFFLAILFIFLVLAAQFESFRDPLIILISVPMSIAGALLTTFLGFASVNIYTQIGLVTLIGLISKHGILMVEFANKLQQNEGLNKRQAIEKAAAIRFRAVLMTTASLVVGVLPLVFATGAGAVGRHDIGLVIASGMAIGTCFTLFVVPMVYTYLAKDHRKSVTAPPLPVN
jgi:hydrophobe/amphiphile efflux-1 (HAE1) family protein